MSTSPEVVTWKVGTLSPAAAHTPEGTVPPGQRGLLTGPYPTLPRSQSASSSLGSAPYSVNPHKHGAPAHTCTPAGQRGCSWCSGLTAEL